MSIHTILLKLCGFRVSGFTTEEFHQNPDLKKCVVIMAPHTSIADFFIGRQVIKYLKLKMVMAMKKEFFVFPFKPFLKKVGCVPVDRQHALHFADFAVDLIKNRDEIAFIICPEGTRTLVPKWKRGFYQIAEKAGVPICVSHINFRSRTAGIGKVFYPTGDYEKDLAEIEQYYYGMHGKNKGWFNLEDKEPYAHPEWLKRD